jgi:hypothetical protein
MDFINRGFSNVLTIALIFLTISFLINILPIALLVGAGVWVISYVVKKARKLLQNGKNIFGNKHDNVEVIYKNEFSSNNIIDVEFTEVK